MWCHGFALPCRVLVGLVPIQPRVRTRFHHTVRYRNAVKLSGGWGVDADFGRPVVAGGGVGFSCYEVVVVAAALDDAGAGAVAAGRVGALEDLGDGLSGRAVQAGGGKRPPGR